MGISVIRRCALVKQGALHGEPVRTPVRKKVRGQRTEEWK